MFSLNIISHSTISQSITQVPAPHPLFPLARSYTAACYTFPNVSQAELVTRLAIRYTAA